MIVFEELHGPDEGCQLCDWWRERHQEKQDPATESKEAS